MMQGESPSESGWDRGGGEEGEDVYGTPVNEPPVAPRATSGSAIARRRKRRYTAGSIKDEATREAQAFLHSMQRKVGPGFLFKGVFLGHVLPKTQKEGKPESFWATTEGIEQYAKERLSWENENDVYRQLQNAEERGRQIQERRFHDIAGDE